MKKIVITLLLIIPFYLTASSSFKDDEGNVLLEINNKGNVKQYKYNNKLVSEYYNNLNLITKKEVLNTLNNTTDTTNYEYDENNKLISVSTKDGKTTYIRNSSGDLILIIITTSDNTEYLLANNEDFSKINKDSFYQYDKVDDNLVLTKTWLEGENDLPNVKIKKKDDRIIVSEDNYKNILVYNKKGQLIKKTTPLDTKEYSYSDDNQIVKTIITNEDGKIVKENNLETKYDKDNNIIEKNEIKGDKTIKTIYKNKKEYALITHDTITRRTIGVKYL